jgi:hypothetical protein
MIFFLARRVFFNYIFFYIKLAFSYYFKIEKKKNNRNIYIFLSFFLKWLKFIPKLIVICIRKIPFICSMNCLFPSHLLELIMDRDKKPIDTSQYLTHSRSWFSFSWCVLTWITWTHGCLVHWISQTLYLINEENSQHVKI